MLKLLKTKYLNSISIPFLCSGAHAVPDSLSPCPGHRVLVPAACPERQPHPAGIIISSQPAKLQMQLQFSLPLPPPASDPCPLEFWKKRCPLVVYKMFWFCAPGFYLSLQFKIVYCFNHTNNIINLTCRCPLYPHALPNLIRSLIIFALDLFFFLLRKYNEASADSPIPSFYFLSRGDWPLARIHCWSSHSYFILPLHSCVFIGIKKCCSTGCYPISHV